MDIQKNCLFFKSYATHPLPASLHCKYNFPASQMLSSTKLFLHSLYTLTNILAYPTQVIGMDYITCIPHCLCSSYLVLLLLLCLCSYYLVFAPLTLSLLPLPCLSLRLLPCHCSSYLVFAPSTFSCFSYLVLAPFTFFAPSNLSVLLLP